MQKNIIFQQYDMQIIPAINALDFEEAKRQARVIKSFLPKGGWLHLDISDGIFASIKSWGDPGEFIRLKLNDYKAEAHIMVENPEDIAESWLKAGINRLIIHIETAGDPFYFINLCKKYDASLMVAVNPETAVENLVPLLRKIKLVQILGVAPGRSGQKFQESSLEKIAFLRQKLPGVKIGVDGGVNPAVAKKAKKAGADIIVSASYVLNSDNPVDAFNELEVI